MRKLFTLVVMLVCLIVLLPLPVQAITIIDGSTQRLEWTPETVGFYANGLYWSFYEDADNNVVFRTSADDGVTWSARTVIRVTDDNFSVYFDGTYMHYAIARTATLRVYYRRGLPNADGTITWSAAESAAEQTGSAPGSVYPDVTVDTAGRPWITYGYRTAVHTVRVSRSSTTDGTWVTDGVAGFPYTAYNPAVPGTSNQALVPLTSNRMVALYSQNDALAVRARRWTGAAWGGETTTASAPKGIDTWSAIAGPADTVHVSLLDGAGDDVRYTEYYYFTNSFGAETVLETDSTVNSDPKIIRGNTTNDLWVFWMHGPVAEHIYYRHYDDSTGVWNARVDWIDESILDGLVVSAKPMSSGLISDDKVHLYYSADAGPPFILKFAGVFEEGLITTLVPAPIAQTTATLRGDILFTGAGGATVRGFEYNTTESAVGATTVSETGNFGAGAYSISISGLNSDNIYFVRAFLTNSLGTTYGDWVDFMSAQAEFTPPEDPSDGGGIAPDIPDEPTSWYVDPDFDSDILGVGFWNEIFGASGYPISFFWYTFIAILTTFLGLMAYRGSRSQLVVFLIGSACMGFFASLGWIGWWMLAPYIIVGFAALVTEKQFSW